VGRAGIGGVSCFDKGSIEVEVGGDFFQVVLGRVRSHPAWVCLSFWFFGESSTQDDCECRSSWEVGC